ncbi:MAG TPA: hypothetical protein VN632_05815 [Stellaceae bacterium]|nr:hypothetical protein [Stellaceae bacterium]
MKKIIYDDAGRDHVVGTAANWTEVRDVCFERGLPIHSVGSEGPDAFYVSPPQRRSPPVWSLRVVGNA